MFAGPLRKTCCVLLIILGTAFLARIFYKETEATFGCNLTQPMGYWHQGKFKWINARCETEDILSLIDSRNLPSPMHVLLIGDSHSQRMVMYTCSKINATLHHWLGGYAVMFSKSAQRRVRRKVHCWCAKNDFAIANLYHFGYFNGTYFNHNRFVGEYTDTWSKLSYELPKISNWVPNFAPHLVVLSFSGYDNAGVIFAPENGVNQKTTPFLQRLVDKTKANRPTERARWLKSLPILVDRLSLAAGVLKANFPHSQLAWSTFIEPSLMGPYEPEYSKVLNMFAKFQMAKDHPDVLLFDISSIMAGRHHDYVDLLHLKPEFYSEILNMYLLELRGPFYSPWMRFFLGAK